MIRSLLVICCAALVLGFAAGAQAGDLSESLKAGTLELKSAGPLAFGPDGVLFVGDTRAATVVAIATGDTQGNASSAEVNVNSIDKKIAAQLGVESADININDMAVNPASGNVYLSVSRGRGPSAKPVIFTASPNGKVAEFPTNKVRFATSALPNPPDENAVDRRRTPLRSVSITDLEFVDGRVIVAGLSNEEFASNLRSIPFPFKKADRGTSVEIYHGAHGAFETRSPVRTFTTYSINGDVNVLAAYQCTPLVRFPLSQLTPGQKVKGTTLAELGNRNRPLDMFVYNKGGKDYILMANSSRGIMKITTEKIGDIEGITERIRGTAGLTYDTIEDLKGVVQLDRLNENNAVVVLETEEGAMHLKTVALP